MQNARYARNITPLPKKQSSRCVKVDSKVAVLASAFLRSSVIILLITFLYRKEPVITLYVSIGYVGVAGGHIGWAVVILDGSGTS